MTWADDDMLAAMRDFAAREGRQPAWSDLRAANGLPGPMTFYRHFGSYTNACVLAGFEAWPANGWAQAKWDETAVIDERVRAGETISQIAVELGMSGQALGRRLVRYRKSMGLKPLRLSTGRRSK